MNETRTASMLQRLPVILAVTASSYGLPLRSPDERKHATASRQRAGKPAAAAGKGMQR